MVDRERDLEVERTSNEYFRIGMIDYLIKIYPNFKECKTLITKILEDYLGCEVVNKNLCITVWYKDELMYKEE